MSRLDKIVFTVVLLWLVVAWTALLVWASRRERKQKPIPDTANALPWAPRALPEDYCPTRALYGNNIQLCRSGHKTVEVTDPGGDWDREQ